MFSRTSTGQRRYPSALQFGLMTVAMSLTGAACSGQAQESELVQGQPVLMTQAREKPNVIVIMADDLGWGDIGLNGSDLIRTPNIDRIGREGVQLTEFYAGANVCTPSRAALMTGRYANRSGMQHVVRPFSQSGLPQSEITVAEVMQSSGYATGMIGKWHLGHQDEHWPTAHGFEEFFGVAYSNDMAPFDLYKGKAVIESPVDQSALTRAYAREAADFIDRHADRPFFLYVAETFPHIPLFVPEDRAGSSAAGLYGDVVEVLDDGVGTILDALETSGIADDTLIVFTSDNGPWFEGDPGHLRGRKGGLHEGGYRVPTVARWPNGLPSGKTVSHMAMNIDLLPTLAALVGADLPEDLVLDGRNILPMMRGEADSPHDVLFFMEGNEIAAVRDERFRLSLRTFYKGFEVPFEQFGEPILYDLSVDPKERFSFNRDHPKDLARLMDAVNAMRADLAGTEIEPESPFGPRDPSTPIGPQLEAHSTVADSVAGPE